MRPTTPLPAMKSRLSAHELLVLESELVRRRKSTLLTYGLWFFLSGFGIHKFYLGKPGIGILYVIGPFVAVVFIFAGVAAAETSPNAAVAPTAVGLLGLLAYGIWWLVDLFTIPRQVNAYNERLEMEIIASLPTPGTTPDSPPERLSGRFPDGPRTHGR